MADDLVACRDFLTTLNARVTTLERDNAELKKENSAQEKKLQELDAKENKSSSSTSSDLVLGTDGTHFPKSELSKTTTNDLGKNIKRNFSKCDNLNILLQYYIIAKGMRNVSVSVAWERLFHLLNSLSPNDLLTNPGLLKMKTLYQDIDVQQVAKQPWKEVISTFMQKVESTMEVTLLTARLGKIEFSEAAAYRVKFEEGLLLLEMMGKQPPSKLELTRVVLSAIQAVDKRAANDMSDEAHRINNGATTVDLQALDYKDVLTLMEKVELKRAIKRNLATVGARVEGSTPRTPTEPENNSGRSRRKKSQKRRRSSDRADNKTPSTAAATPTPQPKGKKCDLCGAAHAKKDCWITTSTSPPECRKCHKTGHLQKVCRSSATDSKGPKEKKGGKKKDQSKPPPKKQKKSRKKDSSSSDSDSEESSNLAVTDSGATPATLALYNELAEQIGEFPDIVLSNPKVKKPEVAVTFCGLARHNVTLDTGTSIDLVDEATVLGLRRLNEEKGNISRKDYNPCSVGVRAAGGSRLTVLGQQWLTVDLGQGITFGAIFVVVRGLGVPALLGNCTMLRVGITIVLKLPDPHILVSKDKGGEVRFPMELETANLISTYLLMYNSSVVSAVQKAEAPVTLSNPPDFGKGGGRTGKVKPSQ